MMEGIVAPTVLYGFKTGAESLGKKNGNIRYIVFKEGFGSETHRWD